MCHRGTGTCSTFIYRTMFQDCENRERSLAVNRQAQRVKRLAYSHRRCSRWREQRRRGQSRRCQAKARADSAGKDVESSRRQLQPQHTLICCSFTSLGRLLTMILLSPVWGFALVAVGLFAAARAFFDVFWTPPTGAVAAGRPLLPA